MLSNKWCNPDDRTIALNENFNAYEVMGIKKKDGVSRRKGRPKSWLERKYKRRKDTQNYSSVRQFFSHHANSNYTGRAR